VEISLDDDTNRTEKSHSKSDSELDPDLYMGMEDDVDAPDSVDLDGVVDIQWDSDDDEEEDEEEEDVENEDEEEVE